MALTECGRTAILCVSTIEVLEALAKPTPDSEIHFVVPEDPTKDTLEDCANAWLDGVIPKFNTIEFVKRGNLKVPVGWIARGSVGLMGTSVGWITVSGLDRNGNPMGTPTDYTPLFEFVYQHRPYLRISHYFSFANLWIHRYRVHRGMRVNIYPRCNYMETPELIKQYRPMRTYAGHWIHFKKRPDECDLFYVSNFVRDQYPPKERTILCRAEPPVAWFSGWWNRDWSDVSQRAQVTVPRNIFTYYTGEFDLTQPENVAKKRNAMSAVVSNLCWYPGHKARLECVKFLASFLSEDEFVVYGKGGNFGLGDRHKGELANKGDGLMPFRYHFAVENNRVPGPVPSYWTEKLSDGILCGCIVLYDGADDVDKYFPPGVVIKIDCTDLEATALLVRSLLDSDYYAQHVRDIMIAQSMIKDRWGPYATVAEGLARFGRAWD